jgi:hypothetical protein
MTDNRLLEVYRQFRTSQEKYIYFLLAADASAIAYALNRAEGRLLTVFLVPWGLSLLFWGASFFFGCMHILYLTSNLYANINLIEVQKGEHPDAGQNPQLINAATKGIQSAMEYNDDKATLFGKLNFSLFLSGVVTYIIWQVLVMYLNTFLPNILY